MKRVLLTGATGFIGANLVRRLLDDGHEVHALVRREGRYWRLDELRDHIHFHPAGLTDADSVIAAMRLAKPDWVFHLAAYGSSSWQHEARIIMDTNVAGFVNLLDACATVGCEAVVNTGSSSEYGFKDHAPRETELPEPASCYAVAKVAATLYGQFVARTTGMPVRTLRLYSVYGPFEGPRRLMPTLILHGLRGTLPPLVGPDVAHDYVHVADVVDALLLAASTTGQETGAVYNVGSGVQTSLQDVVDVVQRVMHIAAQPAWGSMPNRQWDTTHWVADTTRIGAALGWRPRISFEEGFGAMVGWFLRNPATVADYTSMMTNK
jgi:nucleoside-diphosphate-sugar epimerase